MFVTGRTSPYRFSGVALLPVREYEINACSISPPSQGRANAVCSPWLLLVFERLIPVVPPNARFRFFSSSFSGALIAAKRSIKRL
jgi:hypothetical protein